MTSKERDKRAINFTGPDRLPLFRPNSDSGESDISGRGCDAFSGEMR